jgi:hypothetical protein
MTDEEKQARKLRRMRKPVSEVPRSYGPYQMGQYLIARLLADGKAKSIKDLQDFIKLCAVETIEDLDNWFQGSGTIEKTKSEPTTIKQPRKKLF